MRKISALDLVFAFLMIPAVSLSLVEISFAEDKKPVRVGSITDLEGKASIEREGVLDEKVRKGERIYHGDVISTLEESSLKIMLLDDTTFTLGPLSTIVIDEFVYESKTHAGKISTTMAKGVFRFVTGKIAKKRPENMYVELPAGYIGVRGTTAGVQVIGFQSLAFLMENVDDKKRPGKIVVGNVVDGKKKETVVDKEGHGSRIEGRNKAPSEKFEVPKEQVRDMMKDLIPEKKADNFMGVDTVRRGVRRVKGLTKRLDPRNFVPGQDDSSQKKKSSSEDYHSN